MDFVICQLFAKWGHLPPQTQFPIDNPAEFAPSGHYGLLGLHERAELIGAQLEIHSAPDRGTRLVITLPSPDDENASEELTNT